MLNPVNEKLTLKKHKQKLNNIINSGLWYKYTIYLKNHVNLHKTFKFNLKKQIYYTSFEIVRNVYKKSLIL